MDVEYTDLGSPRVVQLRSATTGQVVEVLEEHDPDYQGGALTLDGRYAYVARSTGWIDQIATATRAQQRLVRGQNPAVSPNGRFLAYNTGRSGETPVVRDLLTGVTRAIDLGRLRAGPDDSITWLGGSATLVLAPQPTFINSAAVTRPLGNCGDSQRLATCLIVVEHATSRRPAAHRVALPGPPGVTIKVAGVDSHANMLLLARGFPGGYSTLTRVVIRPAGARVIRTLSLGRRTPVAFSPTGQRIIYQTDTPRALWSATVGEQHLAHAHRLTAAGFWGAAGVW
jgi:hypothetical protein